MGERVTTSDWPPTDSRNTLTLAKLEAAMSAIPTLPKWAMAIRDADKVVVKATDHVEPGTAYTIDPNHMAFAFAFPEPLYAVCHPSDKRWVEGAVETIRSRREHGPGAARPAEEERA